MAPQQKEKVIDVGPMLRRRSNLRLLVVVTVLVLSAFWLNGRSDAVRPVDQAVDDWSDDWADEFESDVLEDSVLEDSVSVWEMRRREVRGAFVDSWDAYAKNAWGHDTYHPLTQIRSQTDREDQTNQKTRTNPEVRTTSESHTTSEGQTTTESHEVLGDKTSSEDRKAPEQQGLGWMIIDSLDTLMIMGLTTRLVDARRWIDDRLDFNQTTKVNVFEATTRLLGGLLSAHYLSSTIPEMASARDHVYLEKARDLAERLLGAFDTASGIPYAKVALDTRTGVPSDQDGGASFTEEATSLQPEMKYLGQLLSQDRFWKKAEKAIKVVDSNAPQDGLVPLLIDPETGKFTTREIRLGAQGGSYYDSLLKQYLQTSHTESIYLTLLLDSLRGLHTHLLTPTAHSHLSILTTLPSGIHHPAIPKMSHRACSLPGTLALSSTLGQPPHTAHDQTLRAAHELLKTCFAMHAVHPTGLAPEAVVFEVEDERLRPGGGDAGDVYPAKENLRSSDGVGMWGSDMRVENKRDARNLLAGETAERLFVLWRVTGDEVYREWGWGIFEAWRNHSRVRGREYRRAGEYGFGRPYTGVENVVVGVGEDEGETGDGKGSGNGLAGRVDSMESEWMARTLKYLYLLFSPVEVLPLTEVVFNARGHVLPVLRGGDFGGGWQRDLRREDEGERV